MLQNELDMVPGWQIVQVLAGGMTFVCGMLPAQSRRIEDLAAGRLLVMEQGPADPMFTQSVILLIHYGTDGVVGLRLDQPSRVPLSRLHEVKGTGKRSDPLYIGGPVGIEEVTALVRAPGAPRNGIHVTGDLYAVQSKSSLEAALKASKGPTDLRVYLGYCGWIIPQLQNEVNRGSWYIFEHGERFAFDSAPGTLWKRLIELTNFRLASTLPSNIDPVNSLSRDR
jgi:putative transcriptional regulator